VTTLRLDIQNYVERLRADSAVCERPREDGEKCPQCLERLRIADALDRILQEPRPVAVAS